LEHPGGVRPDLSPTLLKSAMHRTPLPSQDAP
jgi:hypothetical protein